MKKFIKLFNKVGGKEILKQYCRAHVLFFSVIITMLVGFSKKSLEIVRLAVSNKILNKLRKKYKKFITDYMKQSKEIVQKEEKRRVWVCWFQGMESAPLLVKKCYEASGVPENCALVVGDKGHFNYADLIWGKLYEMGL